MDDCQCPRCVSACLSDPGRLVPDDLPKIAAFLKISEKELLSQWLVRIPIQIKKEAILSLAPVKKKGNRWLAPAGSIVPDYYPKEKGRCLFLDENQRCSIQPVKPFECRAYMGCRHTFLGRPYRAVDVERFFFSRWRKFQEALKI